MAAPKKQVASAYYNGSEVLKDQSEEAIQQAASEQRQQDQSSIESQEIKPLSGSLEERLSRLESENNQLRQAVQDQIVETKVAEAQVAKEQLQNEKKQPSKENKTNKNKETDAATSSSAKGEK